MATLVNPFVSMLHNAPMRCVVALSASGKCILNCKVDSEMRKGHENNFNADSLCRLVACIQQAFDPNRNDTEDSPVENSVPEVPFCHKKPKLIRLRDKWVYTSCNTPSLLISLVCHEQYENMHDERDQTK